MSLIPLGFWAASGGGGGAGAFDLLETQILTSSASSVTFTGLGAYSGYKHLQIRYTARTDQAASGTSFMIARFNGDSGSNYSYHYLAEENGVISAASTSKTYSRVGRLARANNTTGSFASGVYEILDYTSTSKNKTSRSLSGNVTGQAAPFGPQVSFTSSAWYSTSAITSLVLTDIAAANFITGTRFSLYGVK